MFLVLMQFPMHYSNALIGGMLIGFSCVLLWWFMAKIAGISGMTSGLLHPKSANFYWQLAFLFGIFVSPMLLRWWIKLPSLTLSTSIWQFAIAGLLVGIGTKLGSGCTSGHGICGNARLSPRSMLATVLFMSSGFLTVFIGRHLLGLI